MKISINTSEWYPVYSVDDSGGRYALSTAEYEDYVAVRQRFEDWQDKLAALKPDDYVAPKPPTEEELELRRLLASDEVILLLQTPEAA